MTTTYKKSETNLSFAKPIALKQNIIINAENAVVGRVSAIIAQYLMGKNKLTFTRGVDMGSNVIVLNSDKIKFTSEKETTKTYWRHTGFAGGIKSTTPREMMAKGKSDEIISHAVKGMLPKNTFGRNLLKNLKIFSNAEHNITQKIDHVIDLQNLNQKNISTKK